MSEQERKRFRAERERATILSERVFDVQQECARLDFVNRGQDRTAEWVAGQLITALAEFEQLSPPQDPQERAASPVRQRRTPGR